MKFVAQPMRCLFRSSLQHFVWEILTQKTWACSLYVAEANCRGSPNFAYCWKRKKKRTVLMLRQVLPIFACWYYYCACCVTGKCFNCSKQRNRKKKKEADIFVHTWGFVFLSMWLPYKRVPKSRSFRLVGSKAGLEAVLGLRLPLGHAVLGPHVLQLLLACLGL